jgi:sugar phosphate isomerase/epimerase
MRWSLNQISLHGGTRLPPKDLAGDLHALRQGGWRGLEVWLEHWDPFIQAHGLPAARRLLSEHGLTASGVCGPLGTGSLFFSQGDELRQTYEILKRRLEQCRALGAPHMVIAPGFQLPENPTLEALDRAVESLQRAAETAKSFDIRLGIEFLAAARLLNTFPTAWTLVQRAAHPTIGLILDTYHLYAGRSKSEDLDLLQADPTRLFFVHVSDVSSTIPRDLWTVSDRALPGPNSIPNCTLLNRVKSLGYDSDVSLELFSPTFEAAWEADPIATARRAYKACTALESDV